MNELASQVQLFHVKKRLTQWGYWCNHIMTMGLGYTRQSLISKMAEEGALISATIKQLAPHNPDAEEIDVLIEKMAALQARGEGKLEWVQVVRIHYTMLVESLEEKIQYSKLSERTYYRYLKEAHLWLCDQLLIHS